MVTVTHDDMTVETNTGDDAAVRLSMGMPDQTEAPTHEAADDDHDRESAAPAVAVGEAAPADPVDASAAPAADAEKPAKKAKPRDNPQARIAQEIDRRKAAEARAAEVERQLESLRTQAAPKPQPAVVRPKPREEEVGTKYPTYADFIEDMADWKAEQRLAAFTPAQPLDQLVAAEVDRREQARQRVEAQHAFELREEAAKAKYPDYQTRVDGLIAAVQEAGTPFPPVALEAIFSSHYSGDLLYWLATHPTDSLQLAREWSTYGVAAAPLVRQVLEARLGSVAVSGSGPGTKESSAKPPIKPVGASLSAAPSDDPSDDEAFETYFARENARARKAGRR